MIILMITAMGVVFANQNNKKASKLNPKSLAISNKKVDIEAKKKWEASPDGIRFTAWKASPLGKKIQASYDEIKLSLHSFSKMEAVVTCINYQPPTTNTTGPKWLIVKINGEHYMMQFIPREFELLKDLKVNDIITLKSRNAGLSPNHPYLIITADYIEHNNKVLFERDLSKIDGC